MLIGLLLLPTASSHLKPCHYIDLANSAVSTGKIANNAVTTFKVSTTLMKYVTLADNAAGNARGWNPNGALRAFNIDDPEIDSTLRTLLS